MKEIKLSFIVPMYNSEKYLSLCLNSLLNQDVLHDEYEIICVNDGSTDSTKNICLEYKKKYSNIHYYEQENKGVSAARNFGLSKAQGDYIWFIDSDDEIMCDCLAALLEELFSKNLDVIEFGKFRGNSFKNKQTRLRFKNLNKFKNGSCWTKIIRRDKLTNNSICFIESLKYAEDHIWCLQLEKIIQRSEYCPNVLYFYRENDTSVTRQSSSRYVSLESILFLLHETKFKKNLLEGKEKSEFQRTFIWILFMSSYKISEKMRILSMLEEQGDYPYANALSYNFDWSIRDYFDYPVIQIVKSYITKLLLFFFQYKGILILFFHIRDVLDKNKLKPVLDMKEIEQLYYGKQ